MEKEKKEAQPIKTWETIVFIILLIGSGILAFYVSEKVILFYEYGIRVVFEQSIHFVETKPYIVTSAGDTFTRYHNLFYFLFPIIPFLILLFTGAMITVLIKQKITGENY